MKAVVCNTPFDLTVVDRPMPVRADDEILLRIRRVGICGTDYHIYGGNQPFLSYPRVMGHELAGEVVEAPAGSRFTPGQVVTVNPYVACGECVACRAGKPNCCVRIAVLGVHVDGGMCDFLAVPERNIIDAEGLTVDQAAMVEFLAIGAHAVARARLTSDARVLVVGAGPIGVAAALFARLDGARVTIIDTRPARVDLARDQLGFARAHVVGDGTAAALSDETGGDFYDAVFDATGSIHAIRAGLDYVAHGGTYVLISVVKDDLIFPDPAFHKRETSLLASRNALSEDFARVIDAIRRGDIPAATLHTHRVMADDLPVRVPALIEDADHVLKAIVTF